MSAENRGSWKADLSWSLVLFILLCFVTPMLSAMGTPGLFWLGFGLLSAFALARRTRRLFRRIERRMVERIQTKLLSRQSYVRETTVWERLISSLCVTAIAAAMMGLTYKFGWNSRWYPISILSWIASVWVAWFANRKAAPDQQSG